ncbi:protein kinase C and casein kinase substrate in neurons protein 2-like isoform X1 [Puntigrus tetrazona]|uniref:protein kinase C and casein kinase substrate in neurons protein 2-like isoform X1 n=1 Tax=Puntigrus tetrazona TaxID=1606681 RepID=UPI001C89B4B4|nr:protein kinase C and casein kinase substrate in neurons protein 2-like isoform X1 [Puntigrus tetrazona]XP_043093242.1 protein kinase C and casein kinase substrate in neurons protein 2-like isoform X1 [Puntigrus tetrazona]
MSDLTDSLVDVSSDSFWEVGNYKRAVKRVDDGNRLCNDLINCLHERARIEKSYASQLTEWARRWRQLVEKGPQYGTAERAWFALMTEAEKVSDLHMEVKAALMGEDLEKVKNWQKDAYHKQMIGGFKETKEADDGFRKAQKPWAKKLKEVDAMKKAYHNACKEEKTASSRESSSKLDNNNPEAQKKLQEKVEKCQQEVQKTKERYRKSLEELDKVTPQYMENMEQVFEQWQQFEDKRLRFFRDLLLGVKQHLDLSSNHKYATVYHTLEDTVRAADAQEDLRWFRSNHGPGMAMNWPQFEEWSMDLNRTLSRRETKRKHNDGVTLTGISQTTEHTSKTSSSVAVASSSEAACLNPFDDDDDDDGGEDDGGEVEEDEEEPAAERPKSSPLAVKREEVTSQTANGNPFEDEASAAELCVPVRALYDYEGQEQDELSFRAGDQLMKMSEEDEQGWCKGRLSDGTLGLYPANYVEDLE